MARPTLRLDQRRPRRVDVGCQLDHYMGDVGRTAPVSGRFSDGQREAWDLDGFYLEDMVLVEAAGPRVLTFGLPYTAAEIEAAMRAER
jgi:Xaa-Pro aminopeptidase